NEEGMFRGLLFGGLLARLGERKNGIWWAVIISSVAFGCAHVTLDDFDPNNLLTFAQGFLKVVQTGIYAVMLCAVVLKTKNLVGAMLVHAIDDWLLFVVAIGLFGEPLETEYVSADSEEGLATIIFYLIIIALYLPTFIKALREIKRIQAPQFGPFVTETPMAVPAGTMGYLQEPYLQQPYASQPPYQDQGVYAQQYVQDQRAYQQPMQQPYAQAPQQPMQQPGQPYAPQQPQQQVVYYPVPTPAEPLMPTSTMDGGPRFGQVPQQVPQQTYLPQQGVISQRVAQQAPQSAPAPQQMPPAYPPAQQAPVQYPSSQQAPVQYPPVQKYPQQPSSGRPPAPDGF
ncbi:MAG: CPBP family intramembrane metalloprotease, partial [Atopobiaceae bacterium]|nr:CPBP family intramembrane metalloprotease [Atopobiaceae bacterium]